MGAGVMVEVVGNFMQHHVFAEHFGGFRDCDGARVLPVRAGVARTSAHQEIWDVSWPYLVRR